MVDVPVSALFGVGKTIEKKLKALQIETCFDLIFYYPKRFDDFSLTVPIAQLTAGMTATISGTVQLIHNRRSRSRKTITEALIGDESGSVKAIWFNQPFLQNTLPIGTHVRLSGKTSDNFFDLSLVGPSYEKVLAQEKAVHTGRLVPVYSLISGITQKQFRFFVKSALAACGAISDPLPAELLQKLSLLPLHHALNAIHFPDTSDEWTRARRRLAFDELLALQIARSCARKELEEQSAHAIPIAKRAFQFISRLPFTLTQSQKRAADEILNDMARTTPMNRLLEGDVGSGKTVVSAIAAHTVAAAGLQVVYLAPTEILAGQVFETYAQMLSDVSVCLMTGKRLEVRGKRLEVKKNKILQKIKTGEIGIIVGTHALLQDTVRFANVGLAIIDEQHRFGVRQRQTLREKNGDGVLPHLLSMTATPIPRSLALTVYGDLDLSIIDEVPAGRKKIITKIVPANYREWTYEFVRAQVAAGRQAFVICPMVEPSDTSGARSVKAEHTRLSKDIFPALRLDMIHGKLAAEKKESVMRQMLEKKIDILVASSVIEVGIDIPNAAVMLIEGAERFGLAQLHQFRGRVGRGPHQSYCFLLPTTEDKAEVSRLRALVRSTNGFELAEADLRERGAGDIIGSRQSGLPSFKIATLADHDLIALSREWAVKITADPRYRDCVESMSKKDVHLE